MRHIAASDNRRRILLSLLEGKKSLRELFTESGIASPAVIHCLHELESYEFVRADKKRYGLTFLGRGMALKLIDIYTMMGVLKEHETFWTHHDTSDIPDDLLGMILLLRDATVHVSSPADIFEAYQRGIAFFEKAKVFRLVSGIGIPDAEHFVNRFATNQVPLRLVLTEVLLRALIELADLARVAKALEERCKLYLLRRDPKLTLASSDRIMVLMLARLDGPIDTENALTAQSKEGASWRKVLFNHYVQESEMVSL